MPPVTIENASDLSPCGVGSDIMPTRSSFPTKPFSRVFAEVWRDSPHDTSNSVQNPGSVFGKKCSCGCRPPNQAVILCCWACPELNSFGSAQCSIVIPMGDFEQLCPNFWDCESWVLLFFHSHNQPGGRCSSQMLLLQDCQFCHW